MRDKKHRLRTAAQSRAGTYSDSECGLWSRSVQERVLQFSPYLDSTSVALYSPIRNEVATERIRDHALAGGKRLFYPRLGQKNRLDLVRITSPLELQSGRYGILEPVGEERLSTGDAEGLIIFVPGLAFDLHGNRLGRGKGCYDRLIRQIGDHAVFVALAYEFQVAEAVPVECWDQKVNYIITERRVIDCGDHASRSVWVS